jgi:hypothetical protein
MGVVDCIYLTQDKVRCAGSLKSGDEDSGSIKCGKFLD